MSCRIRRQMEADVAALLDAARAIAQDLAPQEQVMNLLGKEAAILILAPQQEEAHLQQHQPWIRPAH